ncbi:hypothetical protein MN116_006604 [Schistosoma mekongi]|uniref:glycogenin glucosyltransferase n=1 Tax=Schistosoma mekongi TaxID=38744 RepID=A0AAE2D3A9_SCHME|nr:hypothetical protein MN116_006604 [Schistosoma mekongi]
MEAGSGFYKKSKLTINLMQLQKQEVIGLLKANRKKDFYDALYTLVPDSAQRKQEFMQLEFDINLFFLTAFWHDYNNDERHASMNEFKLYLETKGSVHSQNTKFLAYYALPYVTKPNEHPIYQKLFEETWRNSVLSRLSNFIDSVIQPNNAKTPNLINLVTKPNVKQDHLMRKLTNELSDAEKRASQYQKRLIRLQLDYQTLISVTADILDALECTLKGKSLDSSILQSIYSRLIHSQHNSSIRISHQNSQFNKTSYCNLRYETKEALLGTKKYETSSHKSTANTGFCWNESTSMPLFELNYEKIKDDIKTMNDRKKCYLLQALRWRLTKSKVIQREHCLTSFIRNDILNLTTIGSLKEIDIKNAPLLYCLKSRHHRVREYMARFINALASLSRGRAYLAQNSLVIEILIDEVRKEHDECITRENFVGALQKMSLRRPMQTVMIKQGVILWVINLLENMHNLSDYTLEYAVALCMNLCLRSSGKRCCIPITGRLLNVLMDLLSIENMDIVPYINGALYSILALSEIRKTAEKMNLKHILKSFIKPDQPEMNRQFEFILQRLNSSEQSPVEDSDDDIDDEDDEEDASTLEADLDQQDLPPPDSNDLIALNGSQTILNDPYLWVGEGLLKHNYAIETMMKNGVNGSIDWCKSLMNRDSELRLSNSSLRNDLPLQRPTTPSQRSARNSVSENRSSTASKNQLYNSSLINHGYDETSNQLNLHDSLATITQSFTDEMTPRCTTPNHDLISSNNYTTKEILSTEKSDEKKVKKILINRQEGQGIFQSRPKILRTPDTSPSEKKRILKTDSRNQYNSVINDNPSDNDNVDYDDDAATAAAAAADDDDDEVTEPNNLLNTRQSPDSTVSSSTHKYDRSVVRNSLQVTNNEIDSQSLLSSDYDNVIEVQPTIKKYRNMPAADNRPELIETFTKIQVWSLIQFSKVVFMDADTLVLQNIDELFDRSELTAAPDPLWPDCFNAGVFLLKPSMDTYNGLLQMLFDIGSFDGREQGLLNTYFSNWLQGDISHRLPCTYNCICRISNDTNLEFYTSRSAWVQFGGSVRVVHFAGPIKPWHKTSAAKTCSQASFRKFLSTNTDRRSVCRVSSMLAYWWSLFLILIRPKFSPDMTGIAGDLANVDYGKNLCLRHAQMEAASNERMYAWERGEIDYTGTDRFIHILNKLCNTLRNIGGDTNLPTGTDIIK